MVCRGQWADKSGWERIAEAGTQMEKGMRSEIRMDGNTMEWGDPRNPDYESRFYGGFCRRAQSVGNEEVGYLGSLGQ